MTVLLLNYVIVIFVNSNSLYTHTAKAVDAQNLTNAIILLKSPPVIWRAVCPL